MELEYYGHFIVYFVLALIACFALGMNYLAMDFLPFPQAREAGVNDRRLG